MNNSQKYFWFYQNWLLSIWLGESRIDRTGGQGGGPFGPVSEDVALISKKSRLIHSVACHIACVSEPSNFYIFQASALSPICTFLT